MKICTCFISNYTLFIITNVWNISNTLNTACKAVHVASTTDNCFKRVIRLHHFILFICEQNLFTDNVKGHLIWDNIQYTFTLTLILNIYFSDPAVFGTLRIQQPMIYDSTTRAQNLVEVLHCIKKFYQVCLLLCCG